MTPRCITSVTPTLCALLGIAPPASCGDQPLPAVLSAVPWPGNAERCLVFAADAIGLARWQRQPEILAPVLGQAPLAVTLNAVMPTVTPVCYGSMFSGALPEVHGIRKYEKPVLTIETLFDALVAARKRVAIVAVEGCSIDRIFRNRPIDYFSEPDDAAVLEQTLPLLEADRYDVIVAYNMAYDSMTHRTAPESEQALAALQGVVKRFCRAAQAFTEGGWRRLPRALLFAPDHGAHIGEDGRGTHGLEIPEDLIVRHCWRLLPGERRAFNAKER